MARRGLAVSAVGLSTDGTIVITDEIIGLEETLAAIDALGARGPDELAGLLFREGQAIAEEAKVIVPFEFGSLQGTIGAHLPERSGNAVYVDVGAGDIATPYALRQHEELAWRHDPPQQAKYLTTPLYRRAPTMDARFADELRMRFGWL